ncbi:hypothetical protein CRUP_029522 [Coryphaenoides rupestris]|nr:hypothetical protein CRUP_029522 [Coryphaenoides rupestris]
MATAGKRRELFTILETSADAEAGLSQAAPLNLSAGVKWFEIPVPEPGDDDDDGGDEGDDDEEEVGVVGEKRGENGSGSGADDAADADADMTAAATTEEEEEEEQEQRGEEQQQRRRRRREQEERQQQQEEEEEEEEEEEDREAADAASFIAAAAGGCNIILVTGNGVKHEEEEEEEQEEEYYAEDCYYAAAAAASSNHHCSFSAASAASSSNDSDIDFSDLEEEERASFFSLDEDPDEDCTSPDFWGEPDQVISIEPFSAASGPQHSLGDDADTRDYFRLLFPDSLFEHMVEQTNSYALYRQRMSGKSDPHWHPTDLREMKAYVGLNILMGINQLPDSGMYWASDIFIGNAGFKKTMTARRFEKLTQYLQLCDRESEPVRGERGYDGLFKIRPLLDVLDNTMWDAYVPNRCLTVDRCGISAAKGRFAASTHRMPPEPFKKGLTVWMLCDSRSGYCHRARIYVGKPSQDAATVSLGYRVVTSLVRGLEGQYHHLFMDGFFTSVPLLQRLLRDGLYACGPTQPSRRGYPEVLCPRNVGKLSPGEFYQCQRGNLVATVTRDVKVVSCLSTNSAPGIVGIGPGQEQQPPPLPSQGERREADEERYERYGEAGEGGVDAAEGGGVGPSLGAAPLGLPRPLPLLLYQENMRGVDLCDRLRECYQVGRPCKRWWRYFLWFYVNLCIVDAYVILRECRGGAPPAGFSGKQFTQRHFRVRLAQQLIGDYQGARGMERAARKRHADSPIEYGHRLERMSERSRRCRNCTNKGLRHESVFGCKICNVHLWSRQQACTVVMALSLATGVGGARGHSSTSSSPSSSSSSSPQPPHPAPFPSSTLHSPPPPPPPETRREVVVVVVVVVVGLCGGREGGREEGGWLEACRLRGEPGW